MNHYDLSNLGASKSGQEVTNNIGRGIQGQKSSMNIAIMETVVGGDALSEGGALSGLKNIDPRGGVAGAYVAASDLVTGSLSNALSGTQNRRATVKVDTTPVDTLSLPMPLELAYNDGANWADDNTAMADLAMAGAAGIAGSFSGAGPMSTLLGAISAQNVLSAARKAGQKRLGIGLEPRKEMFYDGPEFREFSYSWEFGPKNQNESRAIYNAVQTIRKHMYPYRLSETAKAVGFEVWKLPSTYKVSFLLGSEENPYLPKIKPCVISAISYNPTKEGNWKAFVDGAPVASTLDITFREVEVLTQKDIEDGH